MKTTAIKQSIIFSGTPRQIYELWMDSKKHASFTNGAVRMSKTVGGVFSTFDGWATGVNIELIKNKKIVQTWRGDDWPTGHYSTMTINLLPVKNGTKLTFTQTAVPFSLAKDVADGWRVYYWGPMKEALG